MIQRSFQESLLNFTDLNMAKKLLSLLIIFNLVFPSYAFADEEEPPPQYDIVSLEAGDPAPFAGVLLSLDAAAKVAVDKKFEGAECDLRIGYELHLQEQRLPGRTLPLGQHVGAKKLHRGGARPGHRLRGQPRVSTKRL